ncbi:MAG: cytochrome P450 [Myxococcota bacterium]|nr:cytochrome P450 [Myxococcota bacterium]
MDLFERDFFTDPSLIQDPAPFYAALRERGPVVREPHHGVFLVSGFEEVMSIYADLDAFSSVIAPLGPFVQLPEAAAGENLAELVAQRRHEIPLSDQLPALDPPEHTRHRALLGKLFTPNRLKENEEFMWALADGLIDDMASGDAVEFCDAYAGPFTMLVVADLLGVPRDDHATLVGWLQGSGGEKNLAGTPRANQTGADVLARLYPYFTRYIEARRASPGEDILTTLATARFSDGELPEVAEVVRLAVIMFAAGQETTARLLATGMRILAEQPALANELRENPEGIINFTEECLRFESPIKGSFRLALRDIQVAGVDVPVGSILMTMNAAANRDPRVFENGDSFDPRRPNARRNISFGNGEHFCPGASLARAEARISFERLLTRLEGIEMVDPEALAYVSSFLIRGLDSLPLHVTHRA